MLINCTAIIYPVACNKLPRFTMGNPMQKFSVITFFSQFFFQFTGSVHHACSYYQLENQSCEFHTSCVIPKCAGNAIIMTSPWNGKSLCFHAHPWVFLFERNFLHIWTSYHEYITNPNPSVCLSPDKMNFNSKIYKLIFEIYTYLNKAWYGEKKIREKFKFQFFFNKLEAEIQKMNLNSKSYKSIFIIYTYLN